MGVGRYRERVCVCVFDISLTIPPLIIVNVLFGCMTSNYFILNHYIIVLVVPSLVQG